MERTYEELVALAEYYDTLEEEEMAKEIEEMEKQAHIVPQYLVQRILDRDTEEETRESTIMTASELISYVDMWDIHQESFEIYDITNFGEIVHLNYVGWQPMCLIEFATDDGTVVLSGYGTDH